MALAPAASIRNGVVLAARSVDPNTEQRRCGPCRRVGRPQHLMERRALTDEAPAPHQCLNQAPAPQAQWLQCQPRALLQRLLGLCPAPAIQARSAARPFCTALSLLLPGIPATARGGACGTRRHTLHKRLCPDSATEGGDPGAVPFLHKGHMLPAAIAA